MLLNGIWVVFEDLFDVFLGVGVYIDVGLWYENDFFWGVSYIMDRLVFKLIRLWLVDEMLEIVE